MEMYNLCASRSCICCEGENCSKWTFTGTHTDTVAHFLQSTESDNKVLNSFTWICKDCLQKVISLYRKEQKGSLLQQDLESKRLLTREMAKHYQSSMQKITELGFMWRKDIFNSFLEKCDSQSFQQNMGCTANDAMKAYENYFSTRIRKEENIQFHTKQAIRGSLIYDTTSLSGPAVSALYDLYQDMDKMKSKLDTKEVTVDMHTFRSYIDQQAKLFANLPEDIDLREILSNDLLSEDSDNVDKDYFLGKYLHAPLVSYLEAVLDIDNKTRNLAEYTFPFSL